MSTLGKFLVWIVAIFASGCSCVCETQELSSYWENHDFRSLKDFDDIDEAEDKFDGYISLLSSVRHETAVENLNVFLDSAALDTVAYMVWASWFEPFLHAKESPYRNDRLFTVWLDRVLKDNIIDDGAMLERLQQIRNVMGMNIPGQPAADVRLTDSDEREFRISDLKGQRTLLMLLDANCPSCLEYLAEEVKDWKRADIRLVAILVNGSMSHIQHIRSRLSEDVLKHWTLAWCPGREIEKGMIYDLTMVPSRILLDKENRVKKSYY